MAHRRRWILWRGGHRSRRRRGAAEALLTVRACVGGGGSRRQATMWRGCPMAESGTGVRYTGGSSSGLKKAWGSGVLVGQASDDS